MGWIDLRPFLHVVDRSDPCDRESRSPQPIRIARPGAFPQSHAPSVPGHTTSEVRAPASKVSACTSPSAELTVGRPAYLGAPRCLAPDFLDTELSVFMQRLQVQEVAGEPGLA